MEERQITSYRFGNYRLLPFERLLLRDSRPVPLTPKVFDTLLVFIQNSGRLLSKDELMRLIWGDTVVEEGNLTQNIFVIRKILGESPHEHKYLVTIPLKGYRFVAKVREEYQDDAAGRGESSAAQPGVAAAPLTSIAILPFALLNSPHAERFEGISIADTLITKLSGLKQLVVRPTTSVMKYVGVECDPRAVGQELQVDAVLFGSFRQAGERYRVNMRLVNAVNGETLWADKVDDDYTDIFALQDSLAVHVARALKLKLSGDELNSSAKGQTTDSRAYRLYIKGRYYFWNSRTEEGLSKGLEYARQVIELDPENAPAYVSLAHSHALLGEYLYRHPREAFSEAKAAIKKSLQLDPANAEAYACLAEIAFHYEWDWEEAERNYRRSTEVNSGHAAVHLFYAWFLMAMGRLEEAARAIRQAQNQAPLSLMINTVFGLPFYYERRYELAREQFRETLDMDKNFSPARYYLAATLAQLGQYGEAIAEYRRVLSVNHTQQSAALLGYTYARAGEKGRALRILEELRKMSQCRYVSPYLEAVVNAGLGRADEAFRDLERARRERASWMVFLNIDPFLDSLRPDPRFASLLRRLSMSPRPSR